jgi:hypothetical protein
VLAWKFVSGCLGGSLRAETTWVGLVVFHVNSGCWWDMIGEVLGCEVLLVESGGLKWCDDELCVIRGGEGTVVQSNRLSEVDVVFRACVLFSRFICYFIRNPLPLRVPRGANILHK